LEAKTTEHSIYNMPEHKLASGKDNLIIVLNHSNANTVCPTDIGHSSLLRTFGLNATSPAYSYLPVIFGKFALI
jgi:hypothetical protein